MRQVIIYPGEDGYWVIECSSLPNLLIPFCYLFNMYWVIECSSLPGCISQGKNKEEAIENIKEAIKVFINTLKEDNLPVPEGYGHFGDLTNIMFY